MAVRPKEVTTETPQPTPGQNICKDNVLWFLNLNAPEGNQITSKECKLALGYPTGFCNCEKTACQRTAPTSCPTIQAVDCTEDQDGQLFPDETNCAKFKLCSQKKLVTGDCARGLRYNSKIEKCESGLPCYTYRCPSSSSTLPAYIPFRDNPRLYIYCYEGISRVVKCTPEGYAWDNKKNKCDYECVRSGMFADLVPNSPRYFGCYNVRPPFRKEEFTCGAESVFNETQIKCISTATTT